MKILEIVSVMLAAILTIIVTIKWKETDLIGKTAFLIGIIAAFLVGWNAYKANKKQDIIDKINATFGELVDNKKAQLPIVQIGQRGPKFQVNGNGVFSFQPFGSLFKVYIKNNKLYFSAIIRDEFGKVLAAIDDNTWTSFNMSNYEYNNDDNAFEIVSNGDRYVFFHIELKEGIAHIEGFIFSENKTGIGFSEAANGQGGLFHLIVPNMPYKGIANYTENSSSFKKIFKYPRAKYINVRAK